MRPTSSLLGASRLPLTTKRANKDFYKGTGQSYVPGGGHRTGPPGKHVVRGKGKYRLVDEKVRYYVGPGAEALEAASSKGVSLSHLYLL
jgi:large subunit ribosomal protein L41